MANLNYKSHTIEESINCEESNRINERMFYCPISLERFKHPMILISCGHTIDKESLSKMISYQCPLCNKDFVKSLAQTNWSLVHIMGLDVKIQEENNIIISAEKAKEITLLVIEIKIANILKKINELISKETLLGVTSIHYVLKIRSETYYTIIKRLVEKLRKLGYHVATSTDIANCSLELFICWLCNKSCGDPSEWTEWDPIDEY
jgi:hypothetical protein